MKDLLAAIMTKTSGSALSTDVGGRIFEGVAPEESAFPYVVITIVTDYQVDTFKNKLEEVIVQFSLYSISQGLTEITTMFADLKTLFDDAALTITGSSQVIIYRENLTTMQDEFTTTQGTAWGRHWAVDYRIVTQKT